MSASVRTQRVLENLAPTHTRTRTNVRHLSVLHLGKYYPPARGGIESHLEVLSNGLKDEVNLKLIVANDGRQTVRETCSGVPLTRVAELGKLQSAPICPALLNEVRKAKADVVHIHWPNPTAVVAYLLSGHKGKLVFTYHSDVVRQRKLAVIFQPVLNFALNRSSAIIASSPDYIGSSDVLSGYRSKCRVIPFGVPGNYFQQRDDHEVERIRDRYGPQILLAVGRLVYYKGFEYLVRAMAFTKGTLLLVGNGPERTHLDLLARELGVRERIHFLDEVEDLRPYYHAADVFVLPSIMRSEAFGIVQLEAMACAKPIVNTELDSGVNFVSPNGVSGLTVPPRNHVALANALNYLLERPYLRTKLGIGGRQRVAKEFTVQRMIERTLDVYEEVARKGKKGREARS
jgi:glycosyltransferase involved in cell wall biosynthesis